MGSILSLLGLGGGGGGGGGSSTSAASGAPVSVQNTTTSGGLGIWEIVLAVIALVMIGLFLTLHKK
jgi:hypothetical protein